MLLAVAVADAGRQAALEAAGAEVLPLPGADGKVDLPHLMRLLGERGANTILAEGRTQEYMDALDLLAECCPP